MLIRFWKPDPRQSVPKGRLKSLSEFVLRTDLFSLCPYSPYSMFLTDLQSKLKRTDKTHSSVCRHKICFHQKKEISNLIKKPKASPKWSYLLGYKINLTFGAQRKEIRAEIHCETNSTDLWVEGSKDLWEAHYFWIKPLGTCQGGSLELISMGLPQKFPKFAELPKASSDNLLIKKS